jgi:hypothetical protein
MMRRKHNMFIHRLFPVGSDGKSSDGPSFYLIFPMSFSQTYVKGPEANQMSLFDTVAPILVTSEIVAKA